MVFVDNFLGKIMQRTVGVNPDIMYDEQTRSISIYRICDSNYYKELFFVPPLKIYNFSDPVQQQKVKLLILSINYTVHTSVKIYT